MQHLQKGNLSIHITANLSMEMYGLVKHKSSTQAATWLFHVVCFEQTGGRFCGWTRSLLRAKAKSSPRSR